MGTLTYSAFSPAISLPDRILAHLHVVAYRRFVEGRGTRVLLTAAEHTRDIQLDPTEPITIVYSSDPIEPLDSGWLAQLLTTAREARALRIEIPVE